MALTDRSHEWWKSLPLAKRMVTLIIAILTLGLTISATLMLGLLQRHLTSQVDSQLFSSGEALSKQKLTTSASNMDMPTPYYIRRVDINGSTIDFYSPEMIKNAGQPDIPELLRVGEVAQTADGWTYPVTIGSDKAGSTWRVIAIPLEDVSTHELTGVLNIALPLIDVQRTLSNTALYFFLASVVLIIFGGTLGGYLVRRALYPLHNIEAVAGKIAAGDLSQRIEPEPSTTEVGSLAESLNAMLSQVEHSFDSRIQTELKIRQFISDASHELRTPLSAIHGYSELYAMGGIPEMKVPDVMERINSESIRLSHLVNDLVTLARLDEGAPLNLICVDIITMTNDAAFDLRALDPNKTISILAINDASLPQKLTICADREQLQQVFTNLVGNITRYTPPGSPAEIAVGKEDEMAIIEFRDHGPGISEENKTRIFERFFRAEDSRTRAKGGSGLGLPIVASIVHAHGGTVNSYTTPGGGLTVRVELPIKGPFHNGGDAILASKDAPKNS